MEGEKPISAFNYRTCKICGNKYTKKKYANNNQKYCSKRCNKKSYDISIKGRACRERANIKNKIKYRLDKDYKERIRNSYKKYTTSKKGKIKKKEYGKKYRKTIKGKLADIKYRNSIKRKISLDKYVKSNKGKANSFRNTLKRFERLNKIEHKFTKKEWLNLKKSTYGVCPMCKFYVGTCNLTLDHIYPISKAYKDYLTTKIKRIYTINDIQPLCRSCNSKKNNIIDGCVSKNHTFGLYGQNLMDMSVKSSQFQSQNIIYYLPKGVNFEYG